MTARPASRWSFERRRRVGDMAHGITFAMWRRSGGQIRGEAAVGARKLHLDGTASMTLALDQRVYGDELVVQVYTEGAHRTSARRADRYSRVQVYLPCDLATAQVMEEVAQEMRRRVAAKESP